MRFIVNFEKNGEIFTVEKKYPEQTRAEFETAVLGALIDEEFISLEEVNDLRSRIDAVTALWQEKDYLRTRWEDGCNQPWIVPKWDGEETVSDFLKRRDLWINMYILSKVLFDEDEWEIDENDFENEDEYILEETRNWTGNNVISFEMVNNEDRMRPHGCNVHPWTEETEEV